MKATVSGQSEYKERLLDAAGEIIAANGLEGLTAGKLASHVGLRRTVVHYHFGTMDDLLAALVTRSSANARKEVRNHFKPATLGEDIWNLYSVILPGAEAIRAGSADVPTVKFSATWRACRVHCSIASICTPKCPR